MGYANARVKNKKFKLEDLVLRKFEAVDNREIKGKLAPKWANLQNHEGS